MIWRLLLYGKVLGNIVGIKMSISYSKVLVLNYKDTRPRAVSV